MKTLSVKTAIQTGWQKTNEKVRFWVPFTILLVVIRGSFNIFIKDLDYFDPSFYLMRILGFVVDIIVEIIWFKNVLNQYRGETLKYWHPFSVNVLLNYLVFKILHIIPFVIGIVLLIFFRLLLPLSLVWSIYASTSFLTYGLLLLVIVFLFLVVLGMIIAVRLSLSGLLIIDKNMNIVDAMKKSWKVTRGYGWKIFVYYIACIFIIVAGLLCLVVGLLVAIPVIVLGFGYIYNLLLPENEAVSD